MYGHRGVRVGEASHLGPPSLRRLRSGGSRGVPVEISEPLVRHVQRHVGPRVAGVESVADVTQIAASQFSLETVPATHVALFEAGREFAVASVSEDVLDALEADLEVLPAAAGVVANPIDFVVSVRKGLPFWIPLRAT